MEKRAVVSRDDTPDHSNVLFGKQASAVSSETTEAKLDDDFTKSLSDIARSAMPRNASQSN